MTLRRPWTTLEFLNTGKLHIWTKRTTTESTLRGESSPGISMSLWLWATSQSTSPSKMKSWAHWLKSQWMRLNQSMTSSISLSRSGFQRIKMKSRWVIFLTRWAEITLESKATRELQRCVLKEKNQPGNTPKCRMCLIELGPTPVREPKLTSPSQT